MILNYLKKYHELILENKVILESERRTISEDIIKNENYIEKLKKESEAALEGFSPRALDINYESEIKKCRNIIEQLEEQCSRLNENINDVDIEILNLLEDIENVKQYEYKNNQNVEKYEDNVVKDDNDNTKESLKSIVHKVDLCISFMNIDPDRSKMELKNIKKSLENLIDDIE